MSTQLFSGLRHASRRVVAVATIVGVGMVWLLVDVVTDDGPSTTGDTYARIDAYVHDQLDDSRIPGAAVAIVDDSTVAHATGYGTDGNGNPVTGDTPFWIGSNTKSITALAVMQLVEDGALDLDAPVQQYLPEFDLADSDAAATITVRHLVNQTSGIARIDGIRAVAAEHDQTMRDTVTDMADLELNRPVGATFEYANLNSVVLGVVIEAVTGRSWQDHVRERIFDPLAMDTTFTDKNVADAAGLTTTYRSFFGFPIETDGAHLDALVATGYVYSTANDIARYLTMYLDAGMVDGEHIVSPAGIDEMLSPATNRRSFTLQSQSFDASYGAGWFVGPFGVASDARWHQGSLPHFTAWMVLLPDTDQAVVVLVNEGNQFEIAGANAAWSRIPQGVVNILRGEQPPTGTGSARFFIVFTTLVAAIAAAQISTLVRLIREGLAAGRPTWRASIPLAWELGLGGLVVVSYPALTGGLGWSTAFAFLPDLTLSVAVIGGLAVITGATRAALLTRRLRGSPRSADPTPGRAPTPEARANESERIPTGQLTGGRT